MFEYCVWLKYAVLLKIPSPVKCIQLLGFQDYKPIEIHRQLYEFYGNGLMSESGVRQLCLDFNNGRTNVHDKDRRPSLIIKDS